MQQLHPYTREDVVAPYHKGASSSSTRFQSLCHKPISLFYVSGSTRTAMGNLKFEQSTSFAAYPGHKVCMYVCVCVRARLSLSHSLPLSHTNPCIPSHTPTPTLVWLDIPGEQSRQGGINERKSSRYVCIYYACIYYNAYYLCLCISLSFSLSLTPLPSLSHTHRRHNQGFSQYRDRGGCRW